MMKRLSIIIGVLAAVVLAGCEKTSSSGGPTVCPEVNQGEFIILSWSDIIDADAEWKLEKL